MSNGSGSDSGSSSQTSSFDYESEAYSPSGSNFADGQGDDRISFDYAAGMELQQQNLLTKYL